MASLSNILPAGLESEDDSGDDDFKEVESEDETAEQIEQHFVEKRHFYSRSLDAFRFKTESFANLRDDLENILQVAGMSHLLPLFRGQGIGLKEFLIMDDSNFEKLGVTELGERKRLELLVADIHAKPWSERSLIEPGPNFTVTEAVKMISNIQGHLVCMEASLLYLRRIADTKQLMPSERGNFKKLLREVDATALAIPLFDTRLSELRKSLKRMAGSMVELPPAVDAIDADTALNLCFSRLKKITLIATVPLAVFVVYRKIAKP